MSIVLLKKTNCMDIKKFWTNVLYIVTFSSHGKVFAHFTEESKALAVIGSLCLD